MAIESKKLKTTQKNIYKKNHIVRGILVEALPRAEYMKIGDRPTTKSIIESLCSTYKGN